MDVSAPHKSEKSKGKQVALTQSDISNLVPRKLSQTSMSKQACMEKLESLKQRSAASLKSVANAENPPGTEGQKLEQREERREVPSPITQEVAETIKEPDQSEEKAGNEDKEVEERFVQQMLKKIDSINRDAEGLRKQVENFSGGSTDDKDYIYLEEMLIRATVALDNVETRGNTLIKQERKRSVQYIQKLMKMLDSRLKDNKRCIKQNLHTDSDED